MNDQNNPKDLLPVGKSISLNGIDLYIEEKIGEGYTSMVYRGRLNDTESDTLVAIKAVKSNRSEKDFNQEFLTLSRLKSDLLEALKDFPHASDDDYFGYSTQVAPGFYGAGNYENASGYNVPFIVMEFIKGTPVSKVLETEGKIPEFQALVMIWQFFFLLHTLHTKLKKTYSDIKLENLIWQEPTETQKGCLRVLDLGNLYELREKSFFFGNPEVDIYRSASIFLRMLTGKSINSKPESFIEDLPKILKSETISWGTQKFLRQSLHWREEERCADTQAIVHSLGKLVSYWELTDTELINEASQKLVKAEERYELSKASEENLNTVHIPQAEDARNALGILEARAQSQNKALDHFAEDLINRVEVILGCQSHFNIGQEFLKGLSYENARDAFSKGLYNTEEPAKVRRYYYLALVAVAHKEKFSDIKVPLYDVVDCMINENYETAQKIIKTLDEDYQNDEYIAALYHDCEMNGQLMEAVESERLNFYEDAAGHFEAAYQSLLKLPDFESIQIQETGDIRAKYVEMLSMKETIGKAESIVSSLDEVYAKGNLDEVITKIHYAWKRYPLLPGIRDYLVKIYQFEIKACRFNNAIQWAEFATLIDDPQEWNKELATALSLSEMQQHLLCGNFEQFVEKAVYIANTHADNPLIGTVLRELANHYFQQRNVEEFPEEFLREVKVLSNNGLADESLFADQRAAALNAIEFVANSRRQLVDNYLATLEYIDQIENLSPILGRLLTHEAIYMMDESNRLSKAREIVVNAKQLSSLLDGYRLEEVESWNDRVNDELARPEIEQTRDTSRDAWERINAEFVALQDIYNNAPEDNAHPAYYEYATLQGQKLLLDLFDYQSKFEPGVSDVDALFSQVANLMDVYKSGWLRIEVEAEKHTQSLKALCESVKELFYAGKFDQALLEIAELEHQYQPADVAAVYSEINPQLVMTKAYLEYIGQFNAILARKDYSDVSFLDKVFDFLNHNQNGQYSIPRIYFSDFLIDYLIQYHEDVVKKMVGVDISFEDYDNSEMFAQFTTEVVKVEMMLKMLQEKNHG